MYSYHVEKGSGDVFPYVICYGVAWFSTFGSVDFFFTPNMHACAISLEVAICMHACVAMHVRCNFSLFVCVSFFYAYVCVYVVCAHECETRRKPPIWNSSHQSLTFVCVFYFAFFCWFGFIWVFLGCWVNVNV